MHKSLEKEIIGITLTEKNIKLVKRVNISAGCVLKLQYLTRTECYDLAGTCFQSSL